MFSASKTAAPVSGGYQVSNSLRFRSSASAYLNRTFGTPTSSTVWTLSLWVKRGLLTGTYRLFGASTTTYLTFNSSDQLNLTLNGTSAATSTAVFRDPSAWYHIVYQQNGSAQTIYVNNASVATGTTAASVFNTAIAHQLGAANTSNYFDGYMAEINFIDGQALTPSSFGSINTTTGVWQPARYTGSYGTNGFYLKFNNGTSTTTLGNDSSGNGNNWTTNNISLTAGATYDWMIDSPTSYAGSSYGVGNYAVLNPLDQNNATNTNANLTTTLGANTSNVIRSSLAVKTGKWYWEASPITSAYAYSAMIGVSKADVAITSANYATVNGWAYLAANGYIYNNNTGLAYGATYTSGNVIGVALDCDAGTLVFYKNGVSQGTAVSSGITNVLLSPAFGNGTNSNGVDYNVNFGQRPFAYTPPSGFKSLCAQNLPAPAIYNGANHMAATTYTGTGSSLSISNSVNSASFQPDLVWIKSRSAATDHALYDVIRGTQNRLESNTTDAAVAADNGLTAFGSAGFTVNTLAQVNTNAATYVGWQWKAGGTAVTNTAGTITSQVSANTTAGFSVVTYTGTGANATVGHGLGVAPSMIICKSRGTAGTNWGVWHTSLTSYAYFLLLNSTAAQATGANALQALPSSTVISLGASSIFNDAAPMVAYCFAAIAGYSAFGSFSGNASTDGPFVYTGFRPKFVLVKCSSTTGNWYIFDSSRNTYNVLGEQLYPNLSNAGSTATTLDFLSNGFKMRTASDPNASATYIYAAFASSPFQNSLAF